MNYGYIQSKLDGSEMVLDEIPSYQSIEVPITYSYEKFMPKVLDQGSKNICVPCAISSIIDWDNNLNGIKYNVSLDYIFDQRSNESLEGMSIKEALSFIKKDGYVSLDEYKTIKDKEQLKKKGKKIMAYAVVKSPAFLQRSLFINGPFILGLPVKDQTRTDFWNGSSLIGGHAVSCVGYNEEGLRIRNSWGTSYGEGGYATIPNEDFGKILESWVIIKS